MVNDFKIVTKMMTLDFVLQTKIFKMVTKVMTLHFVLQTKIIRAQL